MYVNRYANEKRMDKKAKTHAADGALRQDLANFRKKSEFLFPHLPSRDLNDWQKGVCYHIRSLYTIKRRQ